MANVTDSNFWRSPDDSQPQPTAQSHIVSPNKSEASKTQPAVQHAADKLSRALATAFNSGDQIVWRLPTADTPSATPCDHLLRFDQGHSLDAPRTAGGRDEDQTQSPGPHQSWPWTIVVEEASRLTDYPYAHSLHELQPQRLIIVACEHAVTRAANGQSSLTDSLAEIAGQLGWRFQGPITIDQSDDLQQVVADVKRQTLPSLLHVIASQADNSGQIAAPTSAPPETSPDNVLRAVARVVNGDERVIALTTETSPDDEASRSFAPQRLLPVTAGLPNALSWCAALAAGGSRPIVMLTQEELLDHLGVIRSCICEPLAAVTFVVEGQRSGSLAGPARASLVSAVRHMPEMSVLSPVDRAEFDQMLEWCVSQDAPALIWLPSSPEVRLEELPRAAVVLGGAQRLASGSDVAIVAWGPMVAAAWQASQQLAEFGLAATVVSARFAQPLDVTTIATAIRSAACVVLVDDTAQGGISTFLLDQLARRGITQPLTILATRRPSAGLDTADGGQEPLLAIVQRCRWLAEPIMAVESPLAIAPSASAPATDFEGPWLTFFGQQAAQMALEREQVYATQLSTDVKRWVAAYEEIGSRDLYLWKWCRHGADLTTLPGVVSELRAHVCDTKVLSIVLCVLLDDVADQHGNGQLLDALLELTCWGTCHSWPQLSADEKRHAQVARDLWQEYLQRAATYPRFAEFDPVLRYDLNQFFNTMRYSHLVNGRPYLLNMTEHDLYTSHNMMMISFATLDLMCSPDFPLSEVAALRETMWHAQNMGRIGNLLSTWRRELVERDFTSGLFARALREGDLTLDQLQHGNAADIDNVIRTRGHLSRFFRKWQEHRERCHARARDVRSLELSGVLDGHDRFFAMHLGSQGLI